MAGDGCTPRCRVDREEWNELVETLLKILDEEQYPRFENVLSYSLPHNATVPDEEQLLQLKDIRKRLHDIVEAHCFDEATNAFTSLEELDALLKWISEVPRE